MTSRALLVPAVTLGSLLLFNLLFTESFFALEVRDGRLFGVIVDILNHGSRLVILALGMTLVVATGGVDLSVGAIMAVAGAVAAVRIGGPHAGTAGAAAAALAAALLAGLWNGFLVAALRIQPIVATLVFMVAGRGIAQLVTGGQIVTFTDPGLVHLGNGTLLGLPFPVALAGGLLLLTVLLVRGTALGLLLAATGGSPAASRAAGIDARRLLVLAYAFAGLCAGLAGLIAASNIRAADANNAGLYLELDAILAVVLGGTSLTGGRFSLAGSALGALAIQTLTTTLYMQDVSSEVAPVPKALAILLFCALNPARRRAGGA